MKKGKRIKELKKSCIESNNQIANIYYHKKCHFFYLFLYMVVYQSLYMIDICLYMCIIYCEYGMMTCFILCFVIKKQKRSTII